MKAKVPYTSQELTEAVDRLEKLHGLQARAHANVRLTQEQEAKHNYKQSFDRLTRNVETAEKRLQFMQQAVDKWEQGK